jgi:rubrerythrin
MTEEIIGGKGDSVAEVLDFAIQGEDAAVEFYKSLATKVNDEAISQELLMFADQEQAHAIKLRAIKESGEIMTPHEKVLDLHISKYLVDVEASEDMSYQDILVHAMKKEQMAGEMYRDLAELSQHEDVKNTFLALAEEEDKHKLKFEIEYDEHIFTED